MALTFKNYTKELPKDLLQLAEKNKVRECDEIEKGRFVAYVDEGRNSFDVSITVLTGEKIGNSSCDCGTNISFCRHKTALLNHLAKNKQVKSPIKIKKKVSVTEALMDDVAFEGLKDWVTSLLQKNKEIELAFIQHFSAKNKEYKSEDIAKLVNDAIKATGCNKKNIDVSQIKKLVDLWTEVLKPIVDNYQSGVMDDKAFENLHTMLEHCYQFQTGINSNSTRILKYIESVLKSSETAVNNLQNDEAWYRATGFFYSHIPEGKNNVRMHYLLHLQNIIGTADKLRREKLIDLLANQYKKTDPELIFSGAAYTKVIFELVEANNLFPKYYNIVKPIRFNNDFNQKLIRLLIENNHLELAARYCREQMKSNYREEYNWIYLSMLKEIYTIEGDEANLASVLLQLFPLEYNFDDYLFIIDRLPAEEQKRWRTNILRNARIASSGFKEALMFCFKLMDHEENYKKMMEYVDSHTPYSVIIKYFEPMVSASKNKLLEVLSWRMENSWSISDSRKKDEKENFPELFQLIKKYYGVEYLMLFVKKMESDRYSGLNRLFSYVKEQLLVS